MRANAMSSSPANGPQRRGAGATLRAVSDLVKPELPLAAGLCVFAGEVLALGRLPNPAVGSLGVVVGFLLSGSAMMSNDYFDIGVDLINHPERPLPSGRISVRAVALLTTIFTVGGLLAAAFLGLPAVLFATVVWVVGFAYNAKLKETGLPGNVCVAFSVASTFVLGGLAVGQTTNDLVWTFGGLAFLFDLGEEVASGAMDVAGDAVRKTRSLARLRGKAFALAFAGGSFFGFIGRSLVPFLQGWMGTVPFFLLLGADVVIAIWYVLLIRTRTPEEGRRRLRELYLAMVVVIAGFILAAVV